jgi:peroxiredoxin
LIILKRRNVLKDKFNYFHLCLKAFFDRFFIYCSFLSLCVAKNKNILKIVDIQSKVCLTITIETTKGATMWNDEEIEAISKDTDYQRKTLEDIQSDLIDQVSLISQDPELCEIYGLEK